MPAFYYNNDLGFSAGALAQVYDYGDGTVYPNYRHKFMANVNIYSRGAKQVSFDYDSKFLIPGKRVTASLSYMTIPFTASTASMAPSRLTMPIWTSVKMPMERKESPSMPTISVF